MRLPPLAFWLGCSGLIPFLLGPAWHQFAASSVPPWLDGMWFSYAAMIAAFMAGSFWGFSLPVAQGTTGFIGLVVSISLFLLAWAATALTLRHSLITLAVVFALLLIAEIWHERAHDTVEGYFRLRLTLTIGVLTAIAWRLMQL